MTGRIVVSVRPNFLNVVLAHGRIIEHSQQDDVEFFVGVVIVGGQALGMPREEGHMKQQPYCQEAEDRECRGLELGPAAILK